MGVIRSAPSCDVKLNAENFSDLNFVEASVCGWQHCMQDYTGHAKINEKVSVYYVIDGHGGPDVAEVVAEEIPILLRKNEFIRLEQYKPALENMFEELESKVKKQTQKCSAIRLKYGLPPIAQSYPTAGCSIILALVGENQIIIANIGQCKSYVCYCSNLSKAVLISGNHSESNLDDENRVKNAGGFFLNGRVNGMFPYTRSIGDYSFKGNESFNSNQQLITPTPSIFSLRKQDIKMVVLGSSGIWERTNLVLKELTEDDFELSQLKEKAKGLLQNLICKNPKESEVGLKNMGVLVIDLKH